ncbi:maleylpyruvate isomerase N-terminal domain-containing protein [Streptomyces sp. NPDC050504]|uniref:maleylpyruvate isomerase N-terminal domain-containing protein n=1 Tax=Streptomyces sp. NPDC050504 TaxID=3365618 RepID=UPI00379872BF
MGTAATFDPAAEHRETRAALAAAVARAARLLDEVPDLDAASGLPTWTVGDVGSHLAAAYLGYGSAVAADGAVDFAALLPDGDVPLAERIAAMNAVSIGLFGGEDRARLGESVAEQGEAFLGATEGLAHDAPVALPWFGEEARPTVATATGLLLGESLVHGLDMARGARLPWPIGQDEARLVVGQTMPTTMALALNERRAKGVSIAFDLVVKGGPRLAAVVDDGTMTVTRDAPPRPYDCRITAAPVPFLLVSFRRMPIWKAVASGGMRAGGRRPWLAARLGRLVATP